MLFVLPSGKLRSFFSIDPLPGYTQGQGYIKTADYTTKHDGVELPRNNLSNLFDPSYLSKWNNKSNKSKNLSMLFMVCLRHMKIIWFDTTDFVAITVKILVLMIII